MPFSFLFGQATPETMETMETMAAVESFSGFQWHLHHNNWQNLRTSVIDQQQKKGVRQTIRPFHPFPSDSSVSQPSHCRSLMPTVPSVHASYIQFVGQVMTHVFVIFKGFSCTIFKDFEGTGRSWDRYG